MASEKNKRIRRQRQYAAQAPAAESGLEAPPTPANPDVLKSPDDEISKEDGEVTLDAYLKSLGAETITPPSDKTSMEALQEPVDEKQEVAAAPIVNGDNVLVSPPGSVDADGTVNVDAFLNKPFTEENPADNSYDGSGELPSTNEVAGSAGHEGDSFETASKPGTGDKEKFTASQPAVKRENEEGSFETAEATSPGLTIDSDGTGVDNDPKEEILEDAPEKGVRPASESLSPENRGFFKKMSDAGKRFYEGLFKIPGVNRIVGKMEIAFHQSFADYHEKRAVEHNDRKTALDTQISSLDSSISGIESAVAELEKSGVSNTQGFMLKVRDMQRQKQELMAKKDVVQSKLEAELNKRNIFTNERDRVADKLIGRYDEKLRPMEQEIESLYTDRDQADLIVEVTEAKHRQQYEAIAKIEAQKKQITDSLLRAGMSESKVKSFGGLKMLDKQIAQSRDKLRTEKEAIAIKRNEINRKIAEADERANPYRDKREEFVRVKEGRPIEFKLERRRRRIGFDGEESIISNNRMPEQGNDTDNIGENTPAAAEAAPTNEPALEKNGKPTLHAQLSGWNKFLKDKFPADVRVAKEIIREDDFTSATKLSAEDTLNIDELKKILAKYYKYKKIKNDKFDKEFDKYVKEKFTSRN